MIAAQFGTGIKIVPAVWESMENILPQLEQLDADSPDSRAPVYVGEPRNGASGCRTFSRLPGTPSGAAAA